MAGKLPWAVAAIALVSLIALVAGQRFGASRGGGQDEPANTLQQAGRDFSGGAAPVRAPDISNMSPRERTSRLYSRIMTLVEAGKPDSARAFTIMAISAFQMLDTLDADARYELGRIGEIAGAPELAAAQADTILRTHPNHLLGLVLAAKAAQLRSDTAAVRRYNQALLANQTSELARNLPEYNDHRYDIEAAIADARRRR